MSTDDGVSVVPKDTPAADDGNIMSGDAAASSGVSHTDDAPSA